MRARDLMTPYPPVVTLGDPLSRAAEIMRDHGVGLVPVVDDTVAMHLRGVITDRDIAVRCVAPRHGGRCDVGAHLTATPVTVPADAALDEVLATMRARGLRRLPVTHGGRLVGVVALADLARAAEYVELTEMLEVLEPGLAGVVSA